MLETKDIIETMSNNIPWVWIASIGWFVHYLYKVTKWEKFSVLRLIINIILAWWIGYFTQEIMITSQYCITEDTDNNYYVSIPNKEPKLPNWKKILRINTNAPVPLKDVIDSIREYGNGNQAKVNQILSKHI